MVRKALVGLLNLEPDLEVVAEAGTGDEVLAAALAHRPDVAVLDIEMPGAADGLAAAALLRERMPRCRVLILSGLGRPGQLRRALDAGVNGFLAKTSPPDDLVAAIRTVAGGGRVLDPSLAVAAWDLAQNPLTPRERDVLRAAAQGDDATEIAGRLYLSAGTVRNHLTAIVAKLGARNRTDAVRIAHEAGWL